MRVNIIVSGLNLDVKIRRKVGFRYEYTRINQNFKSIDELRLFLNEYLKENIWGK